MPKNGSIADVLSRRIRDGARERADVPAIIDVRGPRVSHLTWAQLDETTRKHAVRLRDEIAGRPVVVAVDALNRVENLLALVSVLRSGLSCAPVAPRVPPAELDRLLAALGRAHGHVYRLTSIDAALVEHHGSARVSPRVRENRPDYVLAGGGTTGLPRWVGTYHAEESLGGYRTMLRRTGWSEGLRQLVVGPLHHAAPFTHVLAGLIDHHTILLQGVFDAERTWDVITRHGVEWIQLTPAHMRKMSASAVPDPELLRALRGVVHMAAPCDATTKRQWIDLLGGERVHEIYGATEQIGVTIASGTEWLARPGTVGKGFLTRVRIVGENGALPPGRVGTVYLRRAGTRQASRRDLSTVEHTPDGFLTVGDIGWLDEDGYLYLQGRRSDVLQVGGASVFVAEIERVVQEVPGVRDVAVIGAPHDVLGTVPRALVTLLPGTGTDVGAIRQHCRRTLAAHKVPHLIEVVTELPRNEAGKLQRWRLCETPAEPAPGPCAPAEEGTPR